MKIYLFFDSPSYPSLRVERDDCDVVAIRVSRQIKICFNLIYKHKHSHMLKFSKLKDN